jgi:hypothetical protein
MTGRRAAAPVLPALSGLLVVPTMAPYTLPTGSGPHQIKRSLGMLFTGPILRTGLATTALDNVRLVQFVLHSRTTTEQ